MIEVELSDECGQQGSPTNHAYVSALIGYAKRKVRIRGQDYSSLVGKGGGLRIKEIDNYDDDNVLTSFQKYTYDEANTTYGKLILPILFKTHTKGKALNVLNFTFQSTGLNCSAQNLALDINRALAKAGYPNKQTDVPPCTTTNTGDYNYSKGYLIGGIDVYAFDSNPIPDMSTFGYEYFVGYDKVKIKRSIDGGGTINKYFINNVAKSGQLLKIPAIPNTLNGNVSKVEFLNSNNELVKKDEYEYKSFDKKFLKGTFAIDTYAGPSDFYNLTLVNLYTMGIGASGTLTDKIMSGRYHMYFYPINSSLEVVSKHTETFYNDEGNPIVKEKNYFHNNIGQLTKETLKESNLQVSSTEYEYPFDSSTPGDLVTRNFLNAPLKITSKAGNTILKEEKFYYGTLNSKGPLLNYKTSSISGQSDLITDNYFYSVYTDTYNNSIAKVKEQFQSYGNGINTTYNIPNTVKGPKSKYIYGYNYKYIVAKIEGLDAISTDSFISDSVIQNYTGATLENYLNTNLRNNTQVLALNLMVTTYNYDSVTGQLLSTTDPKGLTINYIYDTLHRLKYITDNDGKVIKSIDYNYKQ
jgi:YD repeat-containing protein